MCDGDFPMLVTMTKYTLGCSIKWQKWKLPYNCACLKLDGDFYCVISCHSRLQLPLLSPTWLINAYIPFHCFKCSL